MLNNMSSLLIPNYSLSLLKVQLTMDFLMTFK